MRSPVFRRVTFQNAALLSVNFVLLALCYVGCSGEATFSNSSVFLVPATSHIRRALHFSDQALRSEYSKSTHVVPPQLTGRRLDAAFGGKTGFDLRLTSSFSLFGTLGQALTFFNSRLGNVFNSQAFRPFRLSSYNQQSLPNDKTEPAAPPVDIVVQDLQQAKDGLDALFQMLRQWGTVVEGCVEIVLINRDLTSKSTIPKSVDTLRWHNTDLDATSTSPLLTSFQSQLRCIKSPLKSTQTLYARLEQLKFVFSKGEKVSVMDSLVSLNAIITEFQQLPANQVTRLEVINKCEVLQRDLNSLLSAYNLTAQQSTAVAAAVGSLTEIISAVIQMTTLGGLSRSNAKASQGLFASVQRHLKDLGMHLMNLHGTELTPKFNPSLLSAYNKEGAGSRLSGMSYVDSGVVEGDVGKAQPTEGRGPATKGELMLQGLVDLGSGFNFNPAAAAANLCVAGKLGTYESCSDKPDSQSRRSLEVGDSIETEKEEGKKKAASMSVNALAALLLPFQGKSRLAKVSQRFAEFGDGMQGNESPSSSPGSDSSTSGADMTKRAELLGAFGKGLLNGVLNGGLKSNLQSSANSKAAGAMAGGLRSFFSGSFGGGLNFGSGFGGGLASKFGSELQSSLDSRLQGGVAGNLESQAGGAVASQVAAAAGGVMAGDLRSEWESGYKAGLNSGAQNQVNGGAPSSVSSGGRPNVAGRIGKMLGSPRLGNDAIAGDDGYYDESLQINNNPVGHQSGSRNYDASQYDDMNNRPVSINGGVNRAKMMMNKNNNGVIGSRGGGVGGKSVRRGGSAQPSLNGVPDDLLSGDRGDLTGRVGSSGNRGGYDWEDGDYDIEDDIYDIPDYSREYDGGRGGVSMNNREMGSGRGSLQRSMARGIQSGGLSRQSASRSRSSGLDQDVGGRIDDFGSSDSNRMPVSGISGRPTTSGITAGSGTRGGARDRYRDGAQSGGTYTNYKDAYTTSWGGVGGGRFESDLDGTRGGNMHRSAGLGSRRVGVEDILNGIEDGGGLGSGRGRLGSKNYESNLRLPREFDQDVEDSPRWRYSDRDAELWGTRYNGWSEETVKRGCDSSSVQCKAPPFSELSSLFQNLQATLEQSQEYVPQAIIFVLKIHEMLVQLKVIFPNFSTSNSRLQQGENAIAAGGLDDALKETTVLLQQLQTLEQCA